MLVDPLQAELVLLPVLAVGQMWVPHLLVVVVRKGKKALKLVVELQRLVAAAAH